MSKYLAELEKYNLLPSDISRAIAHALVEDLGGGVDITSESTIAAENLSTANFVARSNGIVAGLNVAAAVMESCQVADIQVLVTEGAQVTKNQAVIQVSGNTRSILLAERTALNFLTHLSGIATLTNKWVQQVIGTKAKIRDTRKTTPGLRNLEKFAVRVAGGQNHRMNLSDEGLIKDNHVFAAKDIISATTSFKSQYPQKTLEVEIDNLDQLDAAINSKADVIMLDNFSISDCKSAVAKINGKKLVEVSGGISLENVKDFALTGVDYIAIGAITHSAPALDFGLDFVSRKGK